MDNNSLVIYGFAMGALATILLIAGFAATGAFVWMAIEKICDYIENHQN